MTAKTMSTGKITRGTSKKDLAEGQAKRNDFLTLKEAAQVENLEFMAAHLENAIDDLSDALHYCLREIQERDEEIVYEKRKRENRRNKIKR